MARLQTFVAGVALGAAATGLGFVLAGGGGSRDPGAEEGPAGAAAAHGRGSFPPGLRPPAGPTGGAPRAASDERAEFERVFRRAYLARTGSEPTAEAAEAAWRDRETRVSATTLEAVEAAVKRHRARVREAALANRNDAVALIADEGRLAERRRVRDDGRAMEALLAPRARGPTRKGPEALEAESPQIEPGTTLEFPAGVWHVETRSLKWNGAFPVDLTIEGAGMDRTLLRFDYFYPRADLLNLRLRDCTVDCQNQPFVDQRVHLGAIRVERVRFVRFDAGHGNAQVFAVEGGAALYCTDCVFAGGYGEKPGKGQVTSNELLARFERCVFERIDYQHYGPATTFERCIFRDCRNAPTLLRNAAATPDEGASFVDCTLDATLSRRQLYDMDAKRRELSSLFPGVR